MLKYGDVVSVENYHLLSGSEPLRSNTLEERMLGSLMPISEAAGVPSVDQLFEFARIVVGALFSLS